MKSAYAGVTQWMRFQASMVWQEVQLCNQGWIEPAASVFMLEPRPATATHEDLLSFNEEVTTAVWLLLREHEALNVRLQELFAQRGLLVLPEGVAPEYSAEWSPRTALRVTRNSIGARLALLQQHGDAVDAHTRLVLKKHAIILHQMVLPALDAVLARASDDIVRALGQTVDGKAAPEQAELIARYRQFLPDEPRPHPDDFLKLAILERV